MNERDDNEVFEQTHVWMVSLTVMMASIMSAIDTTIVNVALPYMRGNLGASIEEISWVSTGYILSSVVMMPIMGFLTARFGRRNFFIFCVALFTVTSMLCGLAWNLESLIFFRIVQGIGGGILLPISQAILRETFPPKQQGLAMGLYGMGVVIGPAVGPLIGGWLTDNYSWPWIFFINIPIGIVNLFLAAKYLKDPSYLVREKSKMDWTGLALLATGIGAFQLFLEKGESKGWFDSGFIIRLLIIAVVTISFFVWRELKAQKPMVNLRILKDRNFFCGSIIGAVFGFCLYGTLFIQPLFLQQLGYTSFGTGQILVPRSIAMAFSMPLAGRLYNRLGARNIIWIGLAITICSYWQFAHLSLTVTGKDLFIPQILQGFGFGLIFVAISTVALATIEKPVMTEAVGLYNVIRQLFSSIGIAVAATLLTNGESRYRSVLVEHVTSYSTATTQWLATATEAFKHKGLDLFSAHKGALALLDQEINRQAQMLSFNSIFAIMSIIFLVSGLLVFILRESKSSEEAEVPLEV